MSVKNINLIDLKMKKTFLIKMLASLFIGGGVLAYNSSCTGDDLFEEEDNDVQTFAKRSMARTGESIDPGTGGNAVYKILSGSASGSSMSGSCTVSVSWTEGYVTRGPYSTLSVTSVSSNKTNARNFSTKAQWVGFYNIDVSIQYTYDVVKRVKDENGRERIELVPTNASDYVLINCPVTFVEEE